MNGTWSILAIYTGGAPTGNLLVLAANIPAPCVFSTAAATGVASSADMVRQGNVVTVTTAATHGLKVGYQAQITNQPDTAVASISSIVIDNEANPGLATVTTAAAHGLYPENYVSLIGVQGVTAGTSISAISWGGGIVTVTTSAAHGLTAGAVVAISGTTNYNTGAVSVLSTPSTTQFTYAWVPISAPASESAGTVTLTWPVPDTATPFYYQVITTPTPTTFTVGITYCNATFATGTVTFPWEGIFFVTAIPALPADGSGNPLTFQYQQYGPNASTSVAGTVTPYGQAGPGQRQMVVLFQTRNGTIPAPSPPAMFITAGGQYIAVTNIPIGPPNIVARILAFTGADGEDFFYIPVPVQNNGLPISTSTVINDNTTTTAFLDFSDNSLFASIGIDIPGNDLFGQDVLDGALGFGFYASRLMTYGQRNRVQNFLSMSFDGGYLPNVVGLPCGWTSNDIYGTLAPGHYGQGWQISVQPGGFSECGSLSQSAYEDAYGDPIIQGNTTYRIRVWLQPQSAVAGLNFFAQLSSASTGFMVIAQINGSSMSAAGSWCETTFGDPSPPPFFDPPAIATPTAIPSDLKLTIYAINSTSSALTLLADELSIIYDQTPYLDQILYGSYVNNPTGFDGVSGKFGPSQDTAKVMTLGIIRQNLYLLTQDPGGRLHSTIQNNFEPAGWVVNEIGQNCGALSAFCLTVSQADDQSGGGGEQFFLWASSSGVRIFGGNQPWKISQEIQPDWTGKVNADGTPVPNTGINFNAATCIWAVNDYVARVAYFGLPVGNALAPSLIYPVNYKQLDTPEQIYADAPIKVGFGGRLICTDNTRKWTRWNVTMNGAALMYRSPTENQLTLTLFGGNAQTIGAAAGFGNVYCLNSAKLTDDDYGQISPYYTTAFLPDQQSEIALQLGGGQKLLAYLTWTSQGVGVLNVTPLIENLDNAWVNFCQWLLQTSPKYDAEYTGGMAQGYRMALQFESFPLAATQIAALSNPSPTAATDNCFTLTRVNAFMKPVKRLPVRGSV
jgi:hypothetical protein